MARPGSRRHAALAALQLACVASRAGLAAPDAVRASPSALVAVNWASSSAYGATASANSAGHWVRGALRKRCSSAAPDSARHILWPAARLDTQAGYTAEPKYALDGDDATYWSSTGGEVRMVARARLRQASNCRMGLLYSTVTDALSESENTSPRRCAAPRATRAGCWCRWAPCGRWRPFSSSTTKTCRTRCRWATPPTARSSRWRGGRVKRA